MTCTWAVDGVHSVTFHYMLPVPLCAVCTFLVCPAGIDGEVFATIERALDERTIGHNPERLNLMKVRSLFATQILTDSIMLCLPATVAATAVCCIQVKGRVKRPAILSTEHT